MVEAQANEHRLLALILIELMGDTPQREKAARLSTAGFDNKEIATLLGTSPAVVRQQLYEIRTSGRSTRRKKGS